MSFQIGGAILDFIVLGILKHKDEYGYVLTQEVRKVLDVSETSMYPALRRLQKQNLLSTYDVAENGRNRRYYKITDEGLEALNAYINEWQEFKVLVEVIINGGK